MSGFFSWKIKEKGLPHIKGYAGGPFILYVGIPLCVFFSLPTLVSRKLLIINQLKAASRFHIIISETDKACFCLVSTFSQPILRTLAFEPFTEPREPMVRTLLRSCHKALAFKEPSKKPSSKRVVACGMTP